MADITYSVKVSEEVQERLKTLVNDSGLNNKDFFINLLSIYETQKAKEITPVLAADIEEMESLTRRINGIFVNVSERLNTIQQQNADQLRQTQDNSNGTIELLQQRIKSLEQDRAEDESRLQTFIDEKEQAETRAAELQASIKMLEESATDKQALIEEYQNKNDTLTSIVNEYKAASEENRTLQSESIEYKRKIDELEAQIKSLRERADERATRHTEDIERLKDTLNIEHEKAILELRTEHQKELQEQQELYNDKVKSLLERLEAGHTAAPPPTSTQSGRTKKATTKKTAGAESAEQTG